MRDELPIAGEKRHDATTTSAVPSRFKLRDAVILSLIIGTGIAIGAAAPLFAGEKREPAPTSEASDLRASGASDIPATVLKAETEKSDNVVAKAKNEKKAKAKP